MKILKLTIKKQWYDMILSGEKKEEYREIKEYWVKRLLELEIEKTKTKTFVPKKYDAIHFYNGAYFSDKLPNFLIECKGIEIGLGNTEWGAFDNVEYFKLKLGELIK